MTRGVPRRTTVVWIALLVAICATWWLGTGHVGPRDCALLAMVLTIVIAFAKISLIGSEFMELRGAPLPLRAAFSLWVVVVGSAAAVFAI
jgi:hypothetical protein